MPEGWLEQPHKARQKDVDAGWIERNGEPYYGYKNHVKLESRSKLIEDFAVTDASVHDSNALEELFVEGGPTTYLGSAYTGPRCEDIFAGRMFRPSPLSDAAGTNLSTEASREATGRVRKSGSEWSTSWRPCGRVREARGTAASEWAGTGRWSR